MNIKVIEITKSLPDYNGKSAKGAYTIKSAKATVEIDGEQIENATIKTFDRKMVLGPGAFVGERDEASAERGYPNTYKLTAGTSSQPAAAQAARPAAQYGNKDIQIIAQSSLKAAVETIPHMQLDAEDDVKAIVVGLAEYYLGWVCKVSGIPAPVSPNEKSTEDKAKEAFA